MRAALRFGAPALLALSLAAGLLADSHVRIVRMSLVVGAVQVKLPDGRGWRPALLNAPLVQGEAVRTLGSGRAEIQFENGSTLRLIPGSQIEFPLLALSDRGVFETTARVIQGTAFATLRKLDSKDFRITLTGDRWAEANGDATLRVDAAPGAAQPVVVLAGKAELHGSGRPLTLKKNEAAQFAGGGSARLVDISAPADPWTKWSETRDQYYEAAFREGVQPGGLTSVVNWNANLGAAMPAYSGVGLNYVGTTACPWTMTSGAYSGWCWSGANGWYFPATPPALNAQSTASASDVSQTNSVLAAQNASPYNVMFYGGPVGIYGGSLGFGMGMNPMGAPVICDDLCMDVYYGPAAFMFNNFYGLYGMGNYYPAAMPANGVTAGGAATAQGPGTRQPGSRLPFSVRPGSPTVAANVALRPPPARAAMGMGMRSRLSPRGFGGAQSAFNAGARPSGIRMSHANFNVGVRQPQAMGGQSGFSRSSGPAAPMAARSAPGAGFGGGMGGGPSGGGGFRGGPAGAPSIGAGAAAGGRVVH